MRLSTSVTIGRNTEEFVSSEITLITNVYATLRIRGVKADTCKRAYDAMLAGSMERFRFQEEDVTVSADRLLPGPEEIQQALDAVASLDLRRMIERVRRERKDFTPERLETAAEQYKQFLVMAILFPDDEIMPISEDMDHVWHAHILHTTQYEDDCQKLFGEFLHHEPADTPIPPFELRERTRALYLSTFGVAAPDDDGFCSLDRLQQRKAS